MMDVGVLVTSHDGYADLWPITAALFTRFWPEREWPMYWMTNRLPVPDIAKPMIRPVIPREQWGINIAAAVEAIPEPFVLLWVEEILPLSRIPNDLFLEAAGLLRTHPDVGIVQLTRYYIQPDVPTVGHFADWSGGEAKAFSAALPALFRKSILVHLLKTLPQSNHFEQQSAHVLFRDCPAVRSLTSCLPMFKLCDNALLSGPWRQCAVKHLTELGFEIDFGIRGICPDACSYMDGVAA